jgi:integrase
MTSKFNESQTEQRRLIPEIRRIMRLKHYSLRTEETYIGWITRYILFHGKTHPREMNKSHIEAFLSHLAVHGKVAASTQNQAFNAILFLYRHVLDLPLEENIHAIRAKRSQRLPTVLSKEEIKQLFAEIKGTNLIIAKLMYAGGLRLMECLRLRVQDMDFANQQLTIHDGKGNKDRYTVFPQTLHSSLRDHLEKVKRRHEDDVRQVMDVFTCRTRLHLNIPKPTASGNGSMCFRRKDYQPIHLMVKHAGIIGIPAPSKWPFRWMERKPNSTNGSLAIFCGTALPRIYCKTVTISGRCRNCWVMPMSARQ